MSIGIVDWNVLADKLQRAYKHLDRIRAFKPTLETLRDDETIYAPVFYFYQNVIERCLGLAVPVLKIERQEISPVARDNFYQLANLDIILGA